MSLLEKFRERKWRHDRLTHRVAAPLSRFAKPTPTDIQALAWDSLIVLDACRVDLFEAVADLDSFAGYERIRSPATSTQEWTERVWADEYLDVVYTTSTPVVTERAGVIAHMENVWVDEWDEERGTVPAELVAERAREAVDRRPDSRHVVHFLQPHSPFIYADDELLAGIDTHRQGRGWTEFDALRAGDISPDDFWTAYKQHARHALGIALRLATDLPGRTVLTSDHGNAMGEHPWWSPVPLYGHPHDVWHPVLYEVPWAVADADEASPHPRSAATVDDRLEALGYV